MRDKDKLILAYYVDVQNCTKCKAICIVNELKNYLETFFDESVKCLVIPSSRDKVEWVNKYSITKDEPNVINQSQTKIEDLMELL